MLPLRLHLPILGLLLAACSAEPAPPPATELFRRLSEASPGAPGEPARPSFLLVVIESLEADTLRSMLAEPGALPTLEGLAARGVVFDQAFAQAGWTMPALTSLLTGRYPPLWTDEGGAEALLAVGEEGLPTILGHYGYHTAAIWGATLPCPFSDRLGFQQVSPIQCGTTELPFDIALRAWIRQAEVEPYFLLLHNIDLHTPEPSAPVERLHGEVGPAQGCPGKGTTGVYEAVLPALGHEAAVAHVLGHYRAQIAFYDEALGRALAALEEAGLMEQTVVVVTTNHGQDLFRHTCFDHGPLYDTILHIPLLWVDPAGGPGRSAAPVQTIDLAPSILARAGIPFTTADGQSLLPLLGGGPGGYTERDLFAASNMRNLAIRARDMKLMRIEKRHPPSCEAKLRPVREARPGPRWELYDLAADPDEEHDLSAERPEEAAALRLRLEAWAEGIAARDSGLRRPWNDPQRQAVQHGGYWDLVGESDPAHPAPGAGALPAGPP